jgi:hypothetical protein
MQKQLTATFNRTATPGGGIGSISPATPSNDA